MNENGRTGQAAGRYRAAQWIVGGLLRMPGLYREFKHQLYPVLFAGSGLENLAIRTLRWLGSFPDLRGLGSDGFFRALPSTSLKMAAVSALVEAAGGGPVENLGAPDLENLRRKIQDALAWLKRQEADAADVELGAKIDLAAALRRAQDAHRKGKP